MKKYILKINYTAICWFIMILEPGKRKVLY